MEDFDKYLNEDATDRERMAAEKVKEGLSGLRLEHKVKVVAEQRRILF